MNLDNNSKPKSIKEFSLVLMIISILMIFANTGAFIMTMFLKIDMSPSDDYVFANIGDKLFSWFTGHLNILYASLIIIGILLFVSSINLKKYRMWSNKLLTFISVFVLINVWIFFISMIMSIAGQNGINIFLVIPILISMITSVPLIIMIRFLNKNEIKSHFS